MERTKKVGEELPEEVKPEFNADPIIRWQKIGGGSLHLAKRLIKPGEMFNARKSEIPMAFRDLVISQNQVTEPSPEVRLNAVKSTFVLRPRGKSKSLFDIVDSSGKVMNDHPLARSVAEKLLKDLG